jgi:N-acylneuraminate cytidylyltransferase/CMP-N,N'-diacetyllegionaminic acid synthase
MEATSLGLGKKQTIIYMSKYKILAIIPARAGSKRIPNKNIKEFLGKPLISYTINQAKKCNYIDRIIVDTDSRHIAKIATNLGVEVPWLRPKKLASDKSQIVDSILYSLDRFKKQEKYYPDYVMILQTTSPLREKKDIDDCWNMMKKTKTGTILTVCPTHPRLYYIGGNNKLILANRQKKISSNVQDWRKGYILNGCFVYIVKTSTLIKERSVITKDTRAVVCPRWRSVDLDTFEDWALAENLCKNKNKIATRIRELNGTK